MTDYAELAARLQTAADAVMAFQWSGEKARMNALHALCQAELAATDAIEAQAAELARVTAERDAAVADADRYGVLRDGAGWPAVFADCHAPEPLRGDYLDAAIDAARQQGQT
jgi:hypothetical protein